MPRESQIYDGTRAISEITSNSIAKGQNKGFSGRIYGRVVNIVMSEKDPLFAKYRVLETIEFEPVQDISSFTESGDKEKLYLSAYKLNSHVKTPLINEIVPLISAPDLQVQLTSGQFAERFYYDSPISLFTSVESNPAPDQNTINNLLPGSSQQSKYQQSTLGVTSNGKSSETILAKNKIRLGDYFSEKGIRSLAPLEGDVKHEGRFGNSLRFGGTPSKDVSGHLPWKGPVGSPITIIRNGQSQDKSSMSSVYEDINKDGSSIYLFSDQTVDFVLANDNFDSYNQKNSNESPNIVVSTPAKQSTTKSAAQEDNVAPSETIAPVISNAVPQHAGTGPQMDDLSSVPDSEDDLNFVTIGQDFQVVLTTGFLTLSSLQGFAADKYIGDKNNLTAANNAIEPGSFIKIARDINIAQNAGKVSNISGINKQGKALLDLIALTEGTMGQGDFNGYDIVYNFYKMKNFTSWQSDPPHPNPKFDFKGNPTSASGRYQIQHGVWDYVAGKNVGMSKVHQDLAGWNCLIIKRRKTPDIISKIEDFNTFSSLIDSLVYEWSSLPTINNNAAGKLSMKQAYDYYIKILNMYK